LRDSAKNVSTEQQPIQQVAKHRKDAVSFAHLLERRGDNRIYFLGRKVDGSINSNPVMTEGSIPFPQSVFAHTQERFDNLAGFYISFGHHNPGVIYPGSALADGPRKNADEF
jgi:hypothetical protein